MVLPVEADVPPLARSPERQSGDAPFSSRLRELHRLLHDDLAWVDAALVEATNQGERPGRDAARHLAVLGGKRVRPMALLLSSACFGKVTPVAREAALVAELVHNATLLHDDVIDDGVVRRNAPTSRMVWGNGVSVLGGDLLLVIALERVFGHMHALLPSLLATLRELVEGEIVQLRGRAELDVSRGTYDRVLRSKTASLFRWATSTGARLGGASAVDQDLFGTVGELVGTAFQLVDDALDYSSEFSDKTALADLREGKMTLPLVLAIERAPGLVESVRKVRHGDDASLAEIRRSVVESGACNEVRRVARESTARALEILGRVARSEARCLLEDLVSNLSERGA